MTENNEKQAEREAFEAWANERCLAGYERKTAIAAMEFAAALAQQPQGEAVASTADWLSGKSVIPQFTLPPAAPVAQGLTLTDEQIQAALQTLAPAWWDVPQGATEAFARAILAHSAPRADHSEDARQMVAEPVAWYDGNKFYGSEMAAALDQAGPVRPVYYATTAPGASPAALTDAQIISMADKYIIAGYDSIAFARDIERALLAASPADQVKPEIVEQSPEDRIEALFKNLLTPYGQLVRALRIVAGTTLMDMAKHRNMRPAYLSAMEFGKKPVAYEDVVAAAGYFNACGIPHTLTVLERANSVSDAAMSASKEGA